MRPEVSAALLGAATGARSFTGVAAVAVTHRAQSTVLDRPLDVPAVRWGTIAAACLEDVVDKLPQTPSRATAAGLVPRALASGYLGAREAIRNQPTSSPIGAPATSMNGSVRDGAQVAPTVGRIAALATIAVGCSLLTALGGARWREFAAGRGNRFAIAAAVAEDLVAMTAALAAARH